MNIRDRTEPDPCTEMALSNAYMRWALMAVEEVAGRNGLQVILREAGLSHLLDDYPPNDMTFSSELRFGDYSALNKAIADFYGRAAKGFAIRIGRVSARHSISDQGAVFGIAGLALKLLPMQMQVKTVLNNMVSTFRKLAAEAGDEFGATIEETGDKFIYRDGTCSVCAGRLADKPMCWIFVGAINEGLSWATGGREFEIEETECKALGAPACVFEIWKIPFEK